MKVHDLVVRSGDSLKSAKLRTLLTMLAIGVGACAMTLGLALYQGGGSFADKILTANIEAHSLWVMKKQDPNGTDLYPSRDTGSSAIWFNGISVKSIKQADLETIGAIEGVDDVQPEFAFNNASIAQQGSANKYQAVVNVARDGAHRVYLAGDSGPVNDDEIVLPEGYSKALGFASPQDAIGKSVDLTVSDGTLPKPKTKAFTYKIKGIIHRSSLSLSVAQKMAVLVSTNTARALNDFMVKGTPQEGTFIAGNARINLNENLETVKQRIINAGYFAQTPNDVFLAMYQFISVLRFTLIIFGIIAVLTAVFGIINTQYISVLERVQEIGLMKAVGMSGGDVKKLFQIEALLIGFIGSIVGTVVAVVIGTFLNPYVISLLSLDSDVTLMEFSVWSTVGVVIILTLTALFAGVLPARRAAKLDPIEALRTDQL